MAEVLRLGTDGMVRIGLRLETPSRPNHTRISSLFLGPSSETISYNNLHLRAKVSRFLFALVCEVSASS
jgi:hypothetical protein